MSCVLPSARYCKKAVEIAKSQAAGGGESKEDMSKRKSAASPSEELMSSDVKKRKRNDVRYIFLHLFTTTKPPCAHCANLLTLPPNLNSSQATKPSFASGCTYSFAPKRQCITHTEPSFSAVMQSEQ